MRVKNEHFKYLKMTLSYTNSKTWYLLLVSLIPSILVAFMISPTASLSFLCNFNLHYSESFGEILLAVLGISTKYYWLGIIGIVAVPFFLSILFGAVERHMRVGEFNLGISKVRARLNFNFITAVKATFFSYFVFVLCRVLESVLFYMFCHTMMYEWAMTLSIIVYLIFFIIELYFLALFILWIPTMLQTGLNSAKSLGLSVRQGTGKRLQIMITLLLPMLPMFIFVIVNAVFNLKMEIVLDSILLMVMTMYYVVLMYTLFFDINGIEREDLKKIDIWKTKKTNL